MSRVDRARVRALAAALLLPLVFIAQSCGGGGGGGPGGSGGTGGPSGGTPVGISPSGELGPTPLTTQTGQVLLSYTLFDTGPSTVSIRPSFAIVTPLTPLSASRLKSFRLESLSFQPATPGLGGDGTTGLAANPAGVPHVFIWNSQKDLGTGRFRVQFEIVPEGAVNGRASVSAPFDVDNPPPPTIVSVTPSGQTNTAPLQVLIAGQNLRFVASVFLTDTSIGQQTNLTQVANPNNQTIFATVPANLVAKNYQLTVQTSAGAVVAPLPFGVFDPVAVVTGVTPTSGANSGTVTLQVSGTNMASTTGIALIRETDNFRQNLTSVKALGSSLAQGVVPAGLASEIYDVTVLNRNISNQLSVRDGVTYTSTQRPTTTFATAPAGVNVSPVAIAIHGTGMLGVTSASMVRRSGPGAASLTAVSVTTGTQVQATIPADLIPDVYDLVVTNPSGNSPVGGITGNATFTVTENPPTVTSVSPVSGLNTGVTHVKVIGTNFEGVSLVGLSGGPTPRSFRPSSITSITQLLADVPAGITPGAYTLNVTNTAGASNTVAFTVTEPLPVVTGLSPTSGVNATPVSVAVSGANFLGASAVTASGPGPTFLTLPVNVTSSSLLGFNFPQENRPGAYTVKVINTAGTSASSQVFTVLEPLPSLTSLSPTTATNIVTTPVTIVGTGLWGTTVVKMVGPVTVSVAPLPPTTDRAVIFDVPSGLRPGNYTVTLSNSAGGSLNSLIFTVTEVVPNVLTISPTTATDDATQNVTITGNHFFGVHFVTILGPLTVSSPVSRITTSNVSVQSDHVVTSQIPALLKPGNYDISVINTAGATASFAVFSVTEKLPVINELDRPLGTSNPSGNYNHPLIEFASGTNMIGTTQAEITPRSGGSPIVVSGSGLVSPSFTSAGVTVPSSLFPGFYDFQVKNSQGLSNALQYEVTEARPAVLNLTPATGIYSSTINVTVGGFNLLGTVDVSLTPNDSRSVLRARQVTDEVAPDSIADASHVLFTVPAQIVPGKYKVTVVNSEGRSDLSTAPTYIVTEPLPSLTSLVPTSAPYSRATTITLNGADLLGTLQVGFHFPPRDLELPPQDVFSSSRIDVTIPALLKPGAYTVNVTNTAGASNALTFNVTEPLPVITLISPSATPYTTTATINVTGRNFLGVSEVDLTGTLESLALKPPSQVSLLTSATLSFISTASTIPDTYTLTVVNTKGRSNAVTFSVTEPVSVLSTVVPTSAPNTTVTSLTLVGTNELGVRRIDVVGPKTLVFTRPAQVSVISSSRTTFSLPALLPPGTYQVDDVNSAGISSNKVPFVVKEVLPVLTKVVPRAGKNDRVVDVTITGSNFLGVNAVALTGPSQSITYTGTAVSVVSFTTVTAAMDLTGLSTATYQLRVVNTAGTSTNSLPFEVTTNTAPTLTSVSPLSALNTSNVTITVNGTQLAGTVSVTLTGPEIFTLQNLVPDNTNGLFVQGVVPASHVPGTYQIQALNAFGDSNDDVTFQITEPPPTLTKIVPSIGSNNVTVTTVITGTNLRGTSTITLFPKTSTGKRGPNRVLLPDTVPTTTTSVTVTIPTSFFPDTYNVTVTDTQGQQAGGITYQVTETAPTVTSISPASAKDTANVTATIKGTALLGTQLVSLAGPTLATTVTTLPVVFFDRDQTRFQAVIPTLLTPGSYVISVNNTVGMSTGPTVTYVVTENLPTVTSVTPNNGSIVAPVPVTVAGNDLLGAFNLKLVGQVSGQPTQNVSVTGVTLTGLSATVPANLVPGTYKVVVQNTAGSSTSSVFYTASEAPATLTAITPSAGPFSSTVNVSITGTGLLGATKVSLSGPSSVTLTPLTTAPGTVTAQIPVNTVPGAYSVSVTTLAGTSTNTVSYNVTESAPGSAGPITITPTSGPRTVTTNVTVSGNNLLGTQTIALHNTGLGVNSNLLNLKVVSASTVTGSVTTGLPLATYFVQITNTAGTFDGSLVFPTVQYTVVSPGPLSITSITPDRGASSGSTVVSLSGTLLSETNLVELGDNLLNVFKLTGVTAKSDTLVTASVPAGIQPGPYEVLAQRAFDSAPTDTGLTFLVEFAGPSVTILSPAIGPAGGGTAVTITGTGFLTGSQVLLGGVPASSATVVDSSHIQIVTPPFPVTSNTVPTPVNVTVIAPDGQTATLANGFTYNANTTNPEVVEFEPLNGQGSVFQNTHITVRFSEAIKPSTATFRQTVRVFQETSPLSGTFTELPSGTVTPSADNQSIVITPGSNLGNGLRVITLVTSGLTDPAGNPLVNNAALGLPSETSFDPNEKQDELFTVGGSTDNTAPTVSSISPVSGATGISTNVTPSATFSETMDAVSFDSTAFTLISPPLVPVSGGYQITGGSSIVTLIPPGRLRGSTTYKQQIRPIVRDLAGNTLSTTFTSASGFRTSPALTVLTTKPKNSDTGVPTNQRLIVVFSSPVAPSTITSTTFQVTPTAGATPIPLSATLSPDRQTAMLTPSTNLTASTNFKWTDNGHITDTLGNPLDAGINIAFKTGAGTDTSQPGVSLVQPADGSTNVPTTTSVTVTFSKPVNPVSFSSGTLKITSVAANVLVPIAYTVSTDLTKAFLTPTSALAQNTLFRVDATTGIQDTLGNALTANVSASFTTDSPKPPAFRPGGWTRLAGAAFTPLPGLPQLTFLTLDGIPRALNGQGDAPATLLVPPSGFTIDCTLLAPAGLWTLVFDSDNPVGPEGRRRLLGPIARTSAGYSFAVTSGMSFPDGANRITAQVIDQLGRASQPVSFAFLVGTPDRPGPIVQTFYVDTFRDLVGLDPITGPSVRVTDSPNGRPDFDDELMALGLEGADAQLNTYVRDLVLHETIARAYAAFGLSPAGPDPAAISSAPQVRFLGSPPPLGFPDAWRAPAARFPYSVLALGGTGQTTAPYVAPVDPLNAYQEDLRATPSSSLASPPSQTLGVFPARALFLGDARAREAVSDAFWPFLPVSGQPIGSVAGDAHLPDGVPTARRLALERAVAAYAAVAGGLLAHASGHLMGLAAQGAPPEGLFGGSSSFPGSTRWHLALPSSLLGDARNLMDEPLDVPTLIERPLALSPLDRAYLEGKLLYRPNEKPGN